MKNYLVYIVSYLLCICMARQTNLLEGLLKNKNAESQTSENTEKKAPIKIQDDLTQNRKTETLIMSQEFLYFKYSDVNYFLNKLSFVKNMIKIYNANEEFPNMNQSMCGEAVCNNYFMEVTNFSLGRAKINKLPIILLVAGLHGNESLGITALMHFLDRAPFLYKFSDQWFRILNNVRFVVVPFANISGFFSEKPEEKIIVNSKPLYIDPKEDFNWKNNQECFRTNTTEFLFRLQQRYMITAALVFTGGSSQIVYPMQPDQGNQKKPSDEKKMFKFVSQMVIEGSRPAFNSAITYSKYRAIGLEDLQSSNKYLMWLNGATMMPNEANVLCFANNKKFKERYVYPTDKSNRVFALEISLEKSLRPKTSLGKIMGVINEQENFNENYGPLVRTFKMIQFFTFAVRPAVEIKSVQNIQGDKLSRLQMDVRGCKVIDEIKFLNYPIASPVFKSENNSEYLKNIATVEILYSYRKLQQDDKSLKSLNPQFSLFCDREQYKLEAGKKYNTLLVQQKNEVEEIEWNKQFLPSLGFPRVTLWNIDLTVPEISKSFEKFHDEVLMIYNDILTFSIGSFFPLTLEYEHEDNYIHLKFDKSQIIRNQISESDSEDIASEFGITNIRERLQYSKRFNTMIDDMSKFWTSIRLSTDQMVGRDNFIEPLNESEKKMLTQDLKMAKMKQEDVDKLFPIENSLSAFSDIASKTDGSTKFDGFHVSLVTSTKACYSYFINLVGSRGIIRIIQKSENKEVNMSNFLSALKKAFVSFEDFRLSGEIMFYNPLTMNQNGKSFSNKIIDAGAFKQMHPLKAFKLWNSGMFCSTLEQTETNRTSFSPEMVKKGRQNEYFRSHPDFYGLTLEFSQKDPNKLLLTLLVESAKPKGKYILHNKAQIFELKRLKGDRLIKVDHVDKPLKLARYQTTLDYEQVFFIGMMLKLFDEQDNELVFDCFLENLSLLKNVETQFRDYMEILFQVMEPDLFDHFFNGVELKSKTDEAEGEQKSQEEEEEEEEEDTDYSSKSSSNLVFSVVLILFLLIILGMTLYLVYVKLVKPATANEPAPEQTLQMQIVQEPDTEAKSDTNLANNPES